MYTYLCVKAVFSSCIECNSCVFSCVESFLVIPVLSLFYNETCCPEKGAWRKREICFLDTGENAPSNQISDFKSDSGSACCWERWPQIREGRSTLVENVCDTVEGFLYDFWIQWLPNVLKCLSFMYKASPSTLKNWPSKKSGTSNQRLLLGRKIFTWSWNDCGYYSLGMCTVLQFVSHDVLQPLWNMLFSPLFMLSKVF